MHFALENFEHFSYLLTKLKFSSRQNYPLYTVCYICTAIICCGKSNSKVCLREPHMTNQIVKLHNEINMKRQTMITCRFLCILFILESVTCFGMLTYMLMYNIL